MNKTYMKPSTEVIEPQEMPQLLQASEVTDIVSGGWDSQEDELNLGEQGGISIFDR